MGTGVTSYPPSSHNHNPRRPSQPGGGHLLGELHAHAQAIPLPAKHQPLPRPDGRRPRHLAVPDAHNRLRRAVLRRELQHVRAAQGE